MSYSRFGVYTTETALRSTPPRSPGTTATVGAFLGTSTRGPATPTLVQSWPDYEKQFGSISPDSDLSYAVYHYFSNGGRVAYVTRVTGASASAAATQDIKYSPTSGATATRAFTLDAKNVGAWGNGLVAVVSPGTVRPSETTLPTFRLSIRLNNTEVEAWTDLSLDPNNSRYVESVLNNFSTFVSVSNVVSGLTPDSGFSFSNPDGGATFSGGSDGADVTVDDYVPALDLLDRLEGTLLINCVGQSDPTVVNAALTVAAARGNSFVIIDPDPELVRIDDPNRVDVNGVEGVSLSYSAAPSYGAVYYPMLKMVDPLRRGPAAIRTTFPGGAVAGAYVRTDTQRGVHKTPAGYQVDVRGALAVAARTSDADVDTLYDAGINVLKEVPGAGVVVLGARTLERTRPDKYIAIRRSLNYVKQGVNDIARSALFEPNDGTMWTALSTRIEQFLSTFWGAGGLKGNTAAQAFYVVCNGSNNDPSSQEEGVVNVEVGVALQYPAEFIVVTVSQWSGGSNTAEALPE
jgi:uncharacterized protein